jgi:hypothetical protein
VIEDIADYLVLAPLLLTVVLGALAVTWYARRRMAAERAKSRRIRS